MHVYFYFFPLLYHYQTHTSSVSSLLGGGGGRVSRSTSFDNLPRDSMSSFGTEGEDRGSDEGSDEDSIGGVSQTSEKTFFQKLRSLSFATSSKSGLSPSAGDGFDYSNANAAVDTEGRLSVESALSDSGPSASSKRRSGRRSSRDKNRNDTTSRSNSNRNTISNTNSSDTLNSTASISPSPTKAGIFSGGRATAPEPSIGTNLSADLEYEFVES